MKVELGFRTYDSVSLLSQIGHKRLLGPSTSMKTYNFDKCIGFILKFWVQWGLICEEWN